MFTYTICHLQRVGAAAAFKALGISFTFDDGSNPTSAAAIAKAADVAVVFGSAHSGEGSDRPDLSLGSKGGQQNINDVIVAVVRML